MDWMRICWLIRSMIFLVDFGWMKKRAYIMFTPQTQDVFERLWGEHYIYSLFWCADIAELSQLAVKLTATIW